MTGGDGTNDSDSTPRALLTNREKDAVRDEIEDKNLQASHIARVRRKISKLALDVQLMRSHHPPLAEETTDAVCREAVEERLDDLDSRLNHVEDKLDITSGSYKYNTDATNSD